MSEMMREKTSQPTNSMRRAVLFRLLPLFLLSAATSCSSPSKEPSTSEAPQAAAQPVEPPNHLKVEMDKFLEASHPNRGVDQPGHEAAFKYLKNEFDAIAKNTDGAKVYVQEFLPDTRFAIESYQKDFDTQIKGKYPPADPMYIKWKNFTDSAVKFVSRYQKIKGKNLILELPATEKDPANKDTRVLYIGAHYDTITHNHETMEFTPKNPTPGADDNASGVIAMLELAKHFSKTPHARTLRFVAFDYEEIFFLGSYHLANTIKNNTAPWKIKNEPTIGLINFEMIGWSTKYITDRPLFKVYTRKKPEVAP